MECYVLDHLELLQLTTPEWKEEDGEGEKNLWEASLIILFVLVKA